jgi:hypothetical protein
VLTVSEEMQRVLSVVQLSHQKHTHLRQSEETKKERKNERKKERTKKCSVCCVSSSSAARSTSEVKREK